MSSLSKQRSSERLAKRSPVKLTVNLIHPRKKVKQEHKDEDDTDDNDSPVISCDFCSKTFRSRAKKLKHITKRHKRESNVCTCHGKLFMKRSDLELHEVKYQLGNADSRKNYRNYTQETMILAYKAVTEGKMATRQAAREFGIPFTTLLDRVRGRFQVNSYMATSGPPPVIKHDDEEKLKLHVDFMAGIGYSYLRHTVTQLATELGRFKGVLEEDKSLTDNWYRKFMRRWPEVARKQRGSKEVTLGSTESIKKYFQEYIHILRAQNVETNPEKIFCLTVYELNVTKLEQNLGKKKVPSAFPADIVSIIFCYNAAGFSIAPFFVFSESYLGVDLLEDCLPNSQSRVSATGEVDTCVFIDYFKNHLLKLLSVQFGENRGPIMLLYNGHLMHFELDRIEWACKHDVLLFTLPPLTQNLEKSIDSELKSLFHQFFRQEAKKYQKKNFMKSVGKSDVCSIVTKVVPQVFTYRILGRMFKKQGIYPVNPESLDPSLKIFDVNDLDDSVFDDLESTDAFFEVRLPFPYAVKRVLDRRNQMPFQPLVKKSVKQKVKLERPEEVSEEYSWQAALNEHSYVHGLDDSYDEQRSEGTVSVNPVIHIPSSAAAIQSSRTQIEVELVESADNFVEEEEVPVMETQVVSSVVEVGTTEADHVVTLEPAIPEPEPANSQVAGSPRYAVVIDPSSNIVYQLSIEN